MLAHTWYALLAIANLSNVLSATVPPSAVKAPAASTSPTPRTDAAVVVTSVDGPLARFLKTPDGAVDGVVLANGAVRGLPRSSACRFAKARRFASAALR